MQMAFKIHSGRSDSEGTQLQLAAAAAVMAPMGAMLKTPLLELWQAFNDDDHFLKNTMDSVLNFLFCYQPLSLNPLIIWLWFAILHGGIQGLASGPERNRNSCDSYQAQLANSLSHL